MHVAQISFFLDPHCRTPEQILTDWQSLVDVAEAAQSAGVRVTVIQACAVSKSIERRGITYYFLRHDGSKSSIVDSRAFCELLEALHCNVFHVHGLNFSQDIEKLVRLMPDVPILVQDHASNLPRFWRRTRWRRGLAFVSAVAFCAAEQAKPFVDAKLLDARTRIFEIPESTSRFTPGDRMEAQAQTGLHGDPCVLWVGHLNSNKDPITVLRGIAEAASRLPDIELWCCFGTAPLLHDVERLIAKTPSLTHKVHLLGKVPHERIELLMRAADIFVLGSHSEGSGYSLIESLACGLPPVVTDIPSFRSLTSNGEVGRIWERGNAPELCSALLSISAEPRLQMRQAARRLFESEISFGGVGRKLAAAYRSIARTELIGANSPPSGQDHGAV